MREHQEIIDLLEQSNSETIIVFGDHFSKTKFSDKINSFKSTEEAKDIITSIQDAKILIKGSRGMKLEKILDLF